MSGSYSNRELSRSGGAGGESPALTDRGSTLSVSREEPLFAGSV